MILEIPMNAQRISVIFALLFAMAFLVGCSEEGPMTPNTGAELGLDGVDQKGAGEAIPAMLNGNNTVGIHMEIWNTIEVVPPDDDPTILHAIFEGGGRSHPFGPFELYSTSVVDYNFYPYHQESTMVFTFRNGDELHGNAVGTGITDPNGNPIFNGDITFTGGTGLFNSASGSGTYAGTADIAAATGQFDIDGQIWGFGVRTHQE
jgi:hypothetical protein